MGGEDNRMGCACVCVCVCVCVCWMEVWWITTAFALSIAFGCKNGKITKTHSNIHRHSHSTLSDSVSNIFLVFLRAREQRKARGPESPLPGPAHSTLSLWANLLTLPLPSSSLLHSPPTRSLFHFLVLSPALSFPPPISHPPYPLLSRGKKKKTLPRQTEDRIGVHHGSSDRQTDCWAEPRDLALPTALILLHSFTGRPSH